MTISKHLLKPNSLPWRYTVEGKEVRFTVAGSKGEFVINFTSETGRDRQLPEILDLLFAVARLYRQAQQ